MVIDEPSARPKRSITYLSEPDLTTADRGLWDSGFPPGFTVDKLHYYRRGRRPVCNKNDHLGIEDGKFAHLKTEYKRSYKNYYLTRSHGDLMTTKDLSPVRASKPEDKWELEDHQHIVYPRQNESYLEYALDGSRRSKRGAFELLDETDMAESDDELRSPLPTSEVQSHFVKHENSERTWPIRPPGSLKLEGDLFSKTETAEKFIEYILGKRRGLIRNSTHLKMEGDMLNKTETGEQFIAMEMQPRPPLVKKFTNLHLEGEMEFDTDYSKTFVPYELEKRPALVKRSTNLKLEGNLEHKPEYMQSYVEFKREKSDLSRPRNNLKVEGNFEASTENMLKFVSHDTSPTIPFLRGGEITKTLMFDGGRCPRHPEYAENYIKHPIERSSPFKRSSQFHLGEADHRPVRQRGNIDFNAEYKNAYVDFHKHGNLTSPTRRRRTYSQINLPEGPMESYPEYKRSFVDFPRNRPILKKPQQHLFYEGDVDHLTEKRAQYIEYPHYGRMDSLKRDQEFKLDGDFECLPEYRKAYVDYLTRERYERKARPLDNLRTEDKSFEVLPPPEDPKKSQKPRPKTGKVSVVIPVSSKEAKPPPPKSSTTEDDTKPSTEPPTTETPTTETPTTETPTEDDSKKKKPPLKSSTLPRPKARKKSISKLETKLFGPKVELKPRSSSSSRLSTPLPPKPKAKVKSKKVESDDELHRESRTGCIYDRKALAEDLAYNPVKSPIPTKKLYSSLAKKSNIRMAGKTAFYVLEDEDINNNHSDGYRSAVKDSFQREQKWMPSWHSP